MATKTKTDETKVEPAEEKVKDTSETVPAGEQTTTETPVEPATSVEPVEEKDPNEDVFVEDAFSPEDFDGSLGTVQEAGYDVPWTYLGPEHFSEDDKPRTSDTDDKDVVKWNVQHAFESEDKNALVPVVATPGQTFHPDELPDYDSVAKFGIDPVQYFSGLPVRSDLGDREVHRRGIPA